MIICGRFQKDRTFTCFILQIIITVLDLFLFLKMNSEEEALVGKKNSAFIETSSYDFKTCCMTRVMSINIFQ